jgi:hypothetical protein
MPILVGLFAAFGFLAFAIVVVFFVRTWRDRRERSKIYAEALARFEAREKAKIVKVGKIVLDPLGREHPWGFELDCLGRVPARSIGIHGEILIAGYTREELLEIARRPSEFEP